MDPRIDRLQRESAADPATIALGGGLPSPAMFPRSALAAAASRVMRREGDRALQYAWPEGREGLRAWVASRLRRRGARVEPGEVIITSGAQQAVALAARVLLRDGASVALEEATYPGALDAFRAVGAALAPLGSPRASCAYATPALSNPRGRGATRHERDALLAWARASGAHVIEDDAYGDLRFDGPAPPTLLASDRARVWNAGTISKTLCPGLRVGWLVAPERYRAEALELKRLADLQSNGLTQSMLEDFLAGDDFDARLVRARRYYSGKAARLAAAVRVHLPEWCFEEPEGGFSLWLAGPEAGDAAELLAVAVRHGVSFDPGEMFLRDGGAAGGAMRVRVCFSLEAGARLEEGARRLAAAWREYRQERAAA